MPHMCLPHASRLAFGLASLIFSIRSIQTMFLAFSRSIPNTVACCEPVGTGWQRSGRLFAAQHQGPEFGGPTRSLLLAAAGDRQGPGLHVTGDDAARGNVGAIADLDGGDKGRV